MCLHNILLINIIVICGSHIFIIVHSELPTIEVGFTGHTRTGMVDEASFRKMAVNDASNRRGCIPIVFVKGTHYEVGYDVGRTFGSIIRSFLEKHPQLNDILIPLCNTKEGKAIYDETLEAVKSEYPQYVAELQGTADGAEVPFHKLFLLHMDDIMPGILDSRTTRTDAAPENHFQQDHRQMDNGGGCSTVMCNMPGEEILTHNEDALSESINHFYFVSAHITSDKNQGKWNVKEERFVSLCYAGTLPGYTMSYNHHGFVFTVNTICIESPKSGKTPRTFLTRSLLAAENLKQAVQMMKDKGSGIGNGVSLNLTFLKEKPMVFYNAEIAPPSKRDAESTVSIVPVESGKYFYHCNRFLRLDIPELNGLAVKSSVKRHEVMDYFPSPKSTKDVINIIGDESHHTYPIYHSTLNDIITTIATGVFNFSDMTWSIYSKNPKHNEPLMVLPIIMKD